MLLNVLNSVSAELYIRWNCFYSKPTVEYFSRTLWRTGQY